LGYIAAPFEFVAGVCILLGFATRYAALAILVFTMVATLIGHRFWEFTRPNYQMQLTQFWKNISMMGGELLLFLTAGGRFSADALLRRKQRRNNATRSTSQIFTRFPTQEKSMAFTRHHLSRRDAIKSLAASALVMSAAPALALNPLKIGFAMSLTGPNSGGGKMFLLGREIWKDEINDRGGVLGRQVQFIYYDDQSNPSIVPGIYAKLLDVDKVDLVVSPFGTNQIAPAMPVIMERRMAFMGLFGTGVNDEFKYDRYFQVLPNGPEGNRSMSRGFFEAAAEMVPNPSTVALVAEDSEFGQSIVAGARANIAKSGLQIVYDRSFPPGTPDHGPLLRAVRNANPDIVFVASYPASSVGMVRAAHEIGYRPRMFGGAMIGLQFTAIKAQLGPLLNGFVINENYVPEPTMRFPGVDDVLQRYQKRAAGAGIDALGFWSPFAYAEMQILSQAVQAVGGIDQGKIAEYIRNTPFTTVIGDVKFGALGEWERSRILYIQYQNVRGNEFNQFREAGKAVILYPPELKSGSLIHPFGKAISQ
jgi:branched-chain amino acid transport system substrate-binding protein